MNPHTELPNEENAANPESVAQPSGLFASFSEVTWTIIGTGFLLGILIGSIFIVGRSGSTGGMFACSTDTESSVATVEVSTVDPIVSSTTDSASLIAEREQLSHQLEAEKLRQEIESLRQELANLQSSTVSVESISTPPLPSPPSNQPTAGTSPAASPGEATLAYWNQLNAIILQEASMRSAPVGGVTASNAGGFLESRVQAAEFATTNIRELETTGVDIEVLTIGKQLEDWYAEGHQVAKTGLHLLTKSSTEERQGSPGRKYQAAERSHSTAVNEINSNGQRVRQAMIEKYRLDFPPLN